MGKSHCIDFLLLPYCEYTTLKKLLQNTLKFVVEKLETAKSKGRQLLIALPQAVSL